MKLLNCVIKVMTVDQIPLTSPLGCLSLLAPFNTRSIADAGVNAVGNDYNVNNDVDGNGDHIDIGNE